MIQKGTMVKIIDNSGASFGRCIHVFNKSNKKSGKVGTMIKISVRHLRKGVSSSKSKIKKGQLFCALIVNTVKKIQHKNGFTTKNEFNEVILVDNNKSKFIGTKLSNNVDMNLRNFGLLRPLLKQINIPRKIRN